MAANSSDVSKTLLPKEVIAPRAAVAPETKTLPIITPAIVEREPRRILNLLLK